jgi:oligopeptidase B
VTVLPSPPVAKQVPHVWKRAAGPIDDPWAWLRDRDDPDTVAYLEAENRYADAWFDQLAPLRDEIFAEIKARTQETDLSVPARHGPWWYVTRTVEGLEYPIHCRGTSLETADEQVVLDQNVEASGHEFFDLGAFDVSPDHARLAWSSDVTGGERFTMRIRDLSSDRDLDDVLEDTYYSTAWSADGAHLFYTRPDASVRPHQVWRHRVGTPQADDVLVWQEDDEQFFLSVQLTRSERFVVVSANSTTTSEVRILPSDDIEREPVVVRPRQHEHDYALDHWNDRFVILTNLDAEDFRVVIAPLDAPDRWDELVAHVPGRRITSVDAFAGHLVLQEWADARQRIRILFVDGAERALAFDDEVHAVGVGSNPDYATSSIRFGYESLVTPHTVFDEDVTTGERWMRKQTPVIGVDLGRYRSTRTWATAADGQRVPVDVVWRDDTPIDGTAALNLYAYGAYESSVPPWFSIARLSLLDRGVVWALAHPRGGGELGRRWYLDGKLDRKRNTFTDVIAAGEHLVAEGYAAPGRLSVRGGSAGGLMVGAVVTMRPDLFRAAIAEVPFVDVVTTMHDPSLPLTIIEWEEWGNPDDPAMEAYLTSYSPYDNVRPTAYPALYVTTGLNDPRVSYHEPAKWVAKLRATATGTATLLFRTELVAGHGGPSGRYDAWRDEARSLGFLLRELGVS